MDRAAQEKRIERLMIPVDTQIMMCDDNVDLSLFAVGMLRKAIHILDSQYTKEERKNIIKEFNEKML
jgi:hypothetical protein